MNDRWIELAGACNVRDLGGLPLRHGGATRSGVLLRADALDGLTDDDVLALIESFGLRHVVDLRSQGERRERGRGPLGDHPITYTEVEVISNGVLGARQSARKQRYAAGDPPDVIMAEGYIHLLELGGPALAQSVDAVAADGGTPALFHCSAGKDRTGVFAALLLDLVGVERDAIVADYALTSERIDAVFARLSGAESFARMAAAVPAFAFGSEPATMEKFLAALTERWGDAAGYLQAAGVSQDTVAALRRRLT